ncbi:MAG: amidohydrolase family protein, partial [Litorimonas sp.]
LVLSMQPGEALRDTDGIEARLGTRRVRRAHAWRTIHQAGVTLTLGSGRSDLAPPQTTLVQTMQAATTRTPLDGTIPRSGWYPREALDRDTALRAMTTHGAHAAFQENALGTLGVGQWADFVVLSANPLETPDLGTVQVIDSYVAGERVAR